MRLNEIREVVAKDAAIEDYNSILRTASQVANRKGEQTNWESFAKRVDEILKKHHETWLRVHNTKYHASVSDV